MQTINIFQAKTHLSKLIEQIASGEMTEPMRLITHDSTVAKYSDSIIFV